MLWRLSGWWLCFGEWGVALGIFNCLKEERGGAAPKEETNPTFPGAGQFQERRPTTQPVCYNAQQLSAPVLISL